MTSKKQAAKGTGGGNEKEQSKDKAMIQQVTPSGYVRKYRKVHRYAMTDILQSFMIYVGDDMTKIKSMRMRDDDVVMVGYPKTGTHWISEILKMILAGKAEYDKESKMNEWIDVQTSEKLESLPSPRVLNTHVLVGDLPDEIMKKKCKVVVLHRNPKDVCVSFFHHLTGLGDFDGTWDDFLYVFAEHKDGVIYNWFQYTRDAIEYEKKHDFVCSVYYEDLKRDSEAEIKRLAKFLNINLSDGVVKEISEKCSFPNLKKASKELKKPVIIRDSPPVDFKFDFFRKGEVGDWKNWFSADQNEKFDKLYAENMKGCDAKFKFTI